MIVKLIIGDLMQLILILIVYSLLLVNCSKNDENIMPDKINNTPRVTGVGGVFFKSSNPDELKKWYGENLGLAINEYGSVFEFRNADRPEEKNYLQWSAFPDSTEYFKPSEKEFMINYRVNNITELVKILKQNGVTVLDEIEEFEYGKFVHILDPEGNKIELWEPVDSVLTTNGSKTNH
jgi:predicted enzyme related to lactoylglutathione lyase